mgnify:CR=1 FL=1
MLCEDVTYEKLAVGETDVVLPEGVEVGKARLNVGECQEVGIFGKEGGWLGIVESRIDIAIEVEGSGQWRVSIGLEQVLHNGDAASRIGDVLVDHIDAVAHIGVGSTSSTSTIGIVEIHDVQLMTQDRRIRCVHVG